VLPPTAEVLMETPRGEPLLVAQEMGKGRLVIAAAWGKGKAAYVPVGHEDLGAP